MTQAEFAGRVVAMQDTLYRVSCTILPQLCDREDAVQSAIEKALRKRMLLRNDSAMEAWLTRILINECRRLIHKKPLVTEIPESLPAPKAENPGLGKAIGSLKMDLRLPVILYYIEGYSVKETAGIMRITQSSVKSRLMRARKKLEEALKKEAAQDE